MRLAGKIKAFILEREDSQRLLEQILAWFVADITTPAGPLTLLPEPAAAARKRRGDRSAKAGSV